MIKDLISNTAILITFIFLVGEIIKYKNFEAGLSLGNKVLGGILTGMLGIILMLYSFSLPYNVIIDLRQLAIIVMAIYGGVLPAFIAGFIMSVFRIIYFGISHISIAAAFLILFVSILCCIFTKIRTTQNKKWLIMNITSILSFSIFYIVTLNKSHIVFNTLIYYWFISTIAGYLVYYITKHIVLSNKLYYKYKTESTKDFLTGLNNVRNFDLQLNYYVNRSKNHGEKLSVLMIDIDFLKKSTILTDT